MNVESVAGAVPPPRRFRRLRALTAFLAWSYLICLLAIWGLLWRGGDCWWPATLLSFGPRVLCAAPWPLLALVALMLRRRSLLLLLMAALIIAGPIMGGTVPWRSLAGIETDPTSLHLRVMTYNCGGGGRNESRIAALLEQEHPDVIVFNEWPSELRLPQSFGKHLYVGRAGTILVASRFPIAERDKVKSNKLAPWRLPAAHFELGTDEGSIHFFAVHLDTPRPGIEAILQKGARGAPELEHITELRRLESELASGAVLQASGPTIVAGDFNMPADSVLYQRYWSRWQNAFSEAGWGFGHSKQTRFYGSRIDHVLADDHWSVISARVLPGIGGDHRPVLVELELR